MCLSLGAGGYGWGALVSYGLCVAVMGVGVYQWVGGSQARVYLMGGQRLEPPRKNKVFDNKIPSSKIHFPVTRAY
jgi:hypothetical protein